ncbi:hypothetical protein LA080_013228 [Diaporthe eres]|nr:hypothetical protein LA080_013228 [Diaporthe eres]
MADSQLGAGREIDGFGVSDSEAEQFLAPTARLLYRDDDSGHGKVGHAPSPTLFAGTPTSRVRGCTLHADARRFPNEFVEQPQR